MPDTQTLGSAPDGQSQDDEHPEQLPDTAAVHPLRAQDVPALLAKRIG